MSDSAFEQAVVVKNPKGLHLRPAELVAKMAMEYDATIILTKDGQEADCKNILSVMTLGAEQGACLGLSADGKDAAEAVTALANLFDVGFHELEASESEQ